MAESKNSSRRPDPHPVIIPLAGTPAETPPGQPASDLASAGSPEAVSFRVDFLWKVHEFTHQHIRFADTKAALVIMGASGLLSALFGARLHLRFLSAAWLSAAVALEREAAVGAAALGAFLLLAGAVVLAVWSILPRVRHDQAPGFLFWENIRSHGDAYQFDQSLSQQSSTDLMRHLQDNLFLLAGVCQAKYACVNWSMRLALLGGMAAGLILLTL
jgi:hypothetical protein